VEKHSVNYPIQSTFQFYDSPIKRINRMTQFQALFVSILW